MKNTALEYLEVALGGNLNVSTLTAVALAELMETYAGILKTKADKWDALDEKIGKYYEDFDEDEDSENEGSLLEIGEDACIAFGYL